MTGTKLGRVADAGAYVWDAFSRKKTLDIGRLKDTELKRCLNMLDLTALGVGSTLGAGIYVITSEVAKNQAGPAVTLSFVIAAVASLLAAVCYAEFASRVPRAGSAYVYSYVSVGEFGAFVIGWNMILENMIGAASVGKAWSQYFDSMINDTIRKGIQEHIGSLHGPSMGGYPDFLALALLIVTTLLVSLGVKMSTMISFVFTIVNLIVIVCILIIGSFHTDTANWTEGAGFFPFGFRGVLSGAATCFYAFVGFDTIATSGEEAINPAKHIPLAIVSTLGVCFIAYFGVSSVLTLMIPFDKLAHTAGLPKAFTQVGVPGIEYVIGIGGLCGLTASMMGCLFPLPRTIYSMAHDGLIFRFMGHVSSWTNTPALATWMCGICAAILALILDLDSLVQMMSIGTLMAYTLVSCSVLILRYQKDNVGYIQADLHTDLGVVKEEPETEVIQAKEDTGLINVGENPSYDATAEDVQPLATSPDVVDETPTDDDQADLHHPDPDVHMGTDKPIWDRLSSYISRDGAPAAPEGSTYHRFDSTHSVSSMFNRMISVPLSSHSSSSGEPGAAILEPTPQSRHIALVSIGCILLSWTLFCIISVYAEEAMLSGRFWAVLLLVVLGITLLTFLLLLLRQPRNQSKASFTVPLVPLIPLLSTMINIYLMLTLSTATWIRFAVWMALGFMIYFGYGIRNSTEKKMADSERILYDVSDRDSIVSVEHYH